MCQLQLIVWRVSHSHTDKPRTPICMYIDSRLFINNLFALNTIQGMRENRDFAQKISDC